MLKKFAIALLAVLPLSAQAEKPKQPGPEQMATVAQMMRELMMPLMMEMAEAVMETRFKVLSERRTAKALTAYSTNYYEERMEAGSTPREALALTAASGIPVVPVSMGRN